MGKAGSRLAGFYRLAKGATAPRPKAESVVTEHDRFAQPRRSEAPVQSDAVIPSVGAARFRLRRRRETRSVSSRRVTATVTPAACHTRCACATTRSTSASIPARTERLSPGLDASGPSSASAFVSAFSESRSVNGTRMRLMDERCT